MGALFAVYKREVVLYFKSFIAYAITFAVMLFLGVWLQLYLNASFNSVAQGGQGFLAADIAINGLFYLIILTFVISPVLSMRLLSEEAREGTLEVLMTMPISEWVFVLGKFLAAWTFFTFILLLTLTHVGLLSILGPINWGILFVAYLGTWLYGGATIALCMIWSAVTEDQLVAAFLGVTSVAGLMLLSFAGDVMEGSQLAANTAAFLRELGLIPHFFDTMIEGLLRAQDVAYFVIMIVISLFITTLIVGTRRWRAS